AHVFLDGRSARHLPGGEKTVIEAGQIVDISPAVAGG
ncbi:MAG: MoaD/ThiS family protein, partial [bacterium]|nr:MoaD/ThiS family protein [bacterium]